MKNKLHFEILTEIQKDLFDKFSEYEWIKDFYLAGGTALALRIGHRQSLDFEFFTNEDLNLFTLKETILQSHDNVLLSESRNTLIISINGVAFSFITNYAKLIGLFQKYNYITIADIPEIGAMKLFDITKYGRKKDFIDLYFISKEFDVFLLTASCFLKYGKANLKNFDPRKSINYFNNADKEPMPLMIKKVNWEDIKIALILHQEIIERKYQNLYYELKGN